MQTLLLVECQGLNVVSWELKEREPQGARGMERREAEFAVLLLSNGTMDSYPRVSMSSVWSPFEFLPRVSRTRLEVISLGSKGHAYTSLTVRPQATPGAEPRGNTVPKQRET